VSSSPAERKESVEEAAGGEDDLFGDNLDALENAGAMPSADSAAAATADYVDNPSWEPVSSLEQLSPSEAMEAFIYVQESIKGLKGPVRVENKKISMTGEAWQRNNYYERTLYPLKLYDRALSTAQPFWIR
jgi:hypothetical protein